MKGRRYLWFTIVMVLFLSLSVWSQGTSLEEIVEQKTSEDKSTGNDVDFSKFNRNQTESKPEEEPEETVDETPVESTNSTVKEAPAKDTTDKPESSEVTPAVDTPAANNTQAS